MRDYSATPSNGGTCIPCCQVSVFAFTAFLIIAERTACESWHAHTWHGHFGGIWCSCAGLFSVILDFRGMRSITDEHVSWKIHFLNETDGFQIACSRLPKAIMLISQPLLIIQHLQAAVHLFSIGCYEIIDAVKTAESYTLFQVFLHILSKCLE